MCSGDNSTSSAQSAPATTPESEGQLQAKLLDQFAAWAQQKRFTAVVDAPNVAYHSQNFPGGCFQIAQVQAVVQKLEAKGEKVRPIHIDICVCMYVYIHTYIYKQVFNDDLPTFWTGGALRM